MNKITAFNLLGLILFSSSNDEDVKRPALEFKSCMPENNLIQKLYSNKMVILSELGNVSKFSEQCEAGAEWSYFMPCYVLQ